jgi:nitrogenase molybdenum-iron protein alpha chain
MNCQTLGSYLAAGLEAHFGVPLVKSIPPSGMAGMDSWLRELGKVTGKESEVEELIAEEKAKILPELAEIRAKLQGRTVYLAMGPGFGHGFLGVLQELGLDVVQATSWHFDQRHDHGECPAATQRLADLEKDIPYSVNDHQNYEIISLLREKKPELYVTRHVGTAVWAAKLGIASLAILDEYAAFGYQGLINFGYRAVDTLANRAFAQRLAGRVHLPYTEWWQQQSAFNFLEDAVDESPVSGHPGRNV